VLKNVKGSKIKPVALLTMYGTPKKTKKVKVKKVKKK
tara:strand:- start:489 stop:599 length:111 start_codon:yes stop_codon:yes gene_type:complete